MLKDDAPFSQPRRAGAVSPTTDQALHLWVDGIGTYLLFLGDKIGIGRSGSSTRPQLALAADIAGYHAEIVRTGDDYFLVAAQGSVQVGGKHVRRKLLADGEVIDLGAGCRMTFKLPTAMSSTAVLSFHRGLRLEGDVRQILLVKDNLILGPGSNCHVKTQTQGENIVLSMGQEGIACRAGEEILVDGQPAGLETAVRLGSHLQIGDLTLTITGSAQGILPQLPARDGGAGFPA